MQDVIVGTLGMFMFLALIQVGQWVSTKSRWQHTTRTEALGGAYREAAFTQVHTPHFPKRLFAICTACNAWAVCTFVLALAGIVFAVVLEDEGALTQLFVAGVALSGCVFGVNVFRASAKLLQRIDGGPRLARLTSVHGLTHHLGVVAVFVAVAMSIHAGELMVAVLPLSLIGLAATAGLHWAGRYVEGWPAPIAG